MQTDDQVQAWVDAQQRTWIATCSVALAIELKNIGLDLLNPDHLSAAYSDPIEFLRLATKLHREQMTERNVSEVDMMDLMTASEEIARRSAAAVEAALVDFFHRIRGGGGLAAVLRRAADAATQMETAQVDTLMGPRGDRAVQAVIDRGLALLTNHLEKLSATGGDALPPNSGAASGPLQP